MPPPSEVELTSPHSVVAGTSGINGVCNDHHIPSSLLKSSASNIVYDLICVGFGPASLAIAVALHDSLETGIITQNPNILFLEKQPRFAWHTGMLLPGAKMQITFIKDLASLRDPRSSFTFLNYLHHKGRLVEFLNLNTFYPSRIEYEDYLRWAANRFTEVVKYNTEVILVSPEQSYENNSLKKFIVSSRNMSTGIIETYTANNILLAIGGQANIPKCLQLNSPRVIHSSQYAHLLPQMLPERDGRYRVAVVGAGQSAAEIFHNIQTLYPMSRTWLIMRSPFFKPSNDSAFVNSIFDPAFVDSVYQLSSASRQKLLSWTRDTNYGVVDLELIEKIYETMYHQRRDLGNDESKWAHRIMGGRQIVGVQEDSDFLRLRVCELLRGENHIGYVNAKEETLEADIVIAATGYERNAHIDILRGMWSLLPEKQIDKPDNGISQETSERWMVRTEGSEDAEGSKTRVLEVARDYRVYFAPRAVAPGSGVWLQGCCEGTHGLSDTLLSVLSTRSGEIVKSIFESKESVNGGLEDNCCTL